MTLVGLVLGGPAAAGLDPASAADTLRPALSVPSPGFVLGSSSGPQAAWGPDDEDMQSWQGELRWSTFDAAGICSQVVRHYLYTQIDDTVAVPVGQKYFRCATNSYDEGKVGGSVFTVTVTDCSGNQTVQTVQAAAYPTEAEPSSGWAGPVEYVGTWATANFAGFSGGQTRYTKAKDATASFNASGGRVGLVMEKAADRGAVDVLVDGVRVATVNTGATKTAHRAVVWQADLAPGTHVVTVKDKATSGRPRVDLDAVLLTYEAAVPSALPPPGRR